MNFPSCNRLLHQKQQSLNNKHHKLKLAEIKNRDLKSATKFIHRRSTSLFENKKQTQKIKCNADNTPSNQQQNNNALLQHTKHKKYFPQHKQLKQPNLNQKSMYSLQKLNKQWKSNKEQSKNIISCKIIKTNETKYNQQISTFTQTYNINKSTFDNCIKMFEQYGLQEPNQDEFKEPQNLVERIIIIKKSILLSDSPYLIQISYAYKRVFVIAYNMSSSSGKTLRYIMSQQKGRILFGEEYQFDFNILISKISIESNRILFKPMQRQVYIDKCQQKDEHVLNYQKQNQFLQRNYYELIYRHRQNETKQENNNQQNDKLNNQNKSNEDKAFKISHRKRLSLASTVKKFNKTNNKLNFTHKQLNSKNQEQNQLSNNSTRPKIQIDLSQKDAIAVYCGKREDFIQKLTCGESQRSQCNIQQYSFTKRKSEAKQTKNSINQYLESFQH